MKKLTKTDFIEKADLAHGNKYDYSLVNYIHSKTKIVIICPIHGEFNQTPRSHLFGKECLKCSYIKRAGNKRKTKTEFIKKAKLTHGNKYGYSLVDYKDSKTKVKIICPIHGVFEQIASNHLKGNNCDKCGGSCKSTIYEFIEKSNIIHNNKYDYSLSEYIRTDIKLKIICPKHGEFEQLANNHLQGYGCPICRESKGEKEIRNYLTENNIKFIGQNKFPDCKYKRLLPFDFYLPDYNICIEFNGKQHYEPIKYFGGGNNFKIQQLKDEIKRKYCEINNIILLIIKYNENIVDELNSCLKNL